MTMTSSARAIVTLPTDTQVLITREFNAPRHLVYKAWTTPELIKRWWSGHRGEVTIVDLDLRVGGSWRYVMVADGGFEVAFHGEYREIVPNQRIVSTEAFEMPGAPEGEAAVVTTTFTEIEGRTRLSLLMELATKKDRDAVISSGMEVGMQEQMDIVEEIANSLS